MTNVEFVVKTTEYDGTENFFGSRVVETSVTGNIRGQLQSIINSPEYERSRTNSSFAISYKLTTFPLTHAYAAALTDGVGKFVYVTRKLHTGTRMMRNLDTPEIYRIVYVEPHAATGRLVISLSTMDTLAAPV